jgi:hypothetical protein
MPNFIERSLIYFIFTTSPDYLKLGLCNTLHDIVTVIVT